MRAQAGAALGRNRCEIVAVQPGDELIVDADVTATRAITIRRSPEVVWPWIVQLGQGRGGFYSYDKLENLLGFDIHSADRVIPELQELKVGDEVRLAPAVALKAAIVEPGRALVLEGALPLAQAPPFDSTWAFILCEQPDHRNRLAARPDNTDPRSHDICGLGSAIGSQTGPAAG